MTVFVDNRPLLVAFRRGERSALEAVYWHFVDAVIWYAPPSEEESSAALEPGVETTLVPRTVELGPEHPPGHYLITAVLSRRPLSREDVRRRLLLPAPGEDVAVVEQKLEIR